MGAKDDERTRRFVAALYEQYYKMLMSMVSRDPQCYPLSEDIVQDTFFEAVRNMDRLLKHENPGGWLTKTAQYKMSEVKRRMRSRSRHETEMVEEEWAYLENEYGLVEIDILLNTVLNSHEKLLFHMFYFEGYSMRELAALERIEESTLRVRMYRIRKRLELYLELKKSRKRKR